MRWLSIVGIGEDGLAGLGENAKAMITNAELVFGGERHLELARAAITGEERAWQSPFSESVDEVVALRESGKRVCVLASGDPFFFGVGSTLSRHVPAEEMDVVPAAPSFSLAASRLGWTLQDVTLVSVHGRPLELILPHLQPGRKILALTSDGVGPRSLADLLVANGFGTSPLVVLEALGGASEAINQTTAETFLDRDVNALNICAIEVVANADARVLARAPGLADALFEHDGQITKRQVRAITLSALAPRRGELLWDIGAGSGSVSIEWMLADPSLRAIAIESEPLRAERAGRNARAFGVPDLRLVVGKAPEALANLPVPDAVFIGGGGSDDGVMAAAMHGLRPGGRLVANAVTLEMEALLLTLHATHGGELARLSFSAAEPLGGMLGWRSAMPITQWVWVKP